MKDCPDFVCYKCGELGHVAKNCTRQRYDSFGKCDKCHKDTQSCMCHRDNITDITPETEDVTREERLELQSVEEDKEEAENKIQDNDSREREDNENNRVEMTNEEIESEEGANYNLNISDESAIDSGDDRMEDD
ncbi:hypothetical protein CHS0354_007900 [Potamilus streckersoni]|uniref:CCHC-type domain-containing protein n=1 Tax=Potamilus streckersoni TaxID=2493646 RepID=A0AAE0S8Q3_9BIVA|nr:hypothetical protein CHS0354_007900 [Potamilus streckersoni]